MKTKVHFRIWDGEVIALFPEELWDQKGNITCYQHIGQHGGSHPSLIRRLPAASEAEYKNLKNELESHFSYNFEILP